METTDALLIYGGLFLWSFLAAMLLPLGSEPALVALAGTIRIPFLPFSVWVLIGKALRYAVVAWAAGAL